MHTHRPLLAALAMLLAAWGAAAAQDAPKGVQPRVAVVAPTARPEPSERDVRRLIELTGLVEKELASFDPLMESLKKQTPQVSDEVWAEIREEFRKSFNREAIIKMYVPIYARHFSAVEVRQLIAFYASPVGKRLVAETPLIESEAFFKGMERGMSLGERLRELLKSKGYKVPST